MDQLIRDLEASAKRAGSGSHIEQCAGCGADLAVPDDSRFPEMRSWCNDCMADRHASFEDKIRNALLQLGPGDHPNILTAHPMRRALA